MRVGAVFIKENDKVLLGDLFGVVQAIYNNIVYVYFQDGVIRQFNLNGILNEERLKNY
jgi:hypothetical protein